MAAPSSPASAPPAPPPAPYPIPPPPPPTPAYSAEETVRRSLELGRTLSIVIALLAGLLFVVVLLLSVLQALLGLGIGGFATAAYCLISAVVNFVLWRELPTLQALAAQRSYAALRDQLLLWVILGLFFFVVVGVILLIAWLKVETLVNPTGAVSQVIGPPPPPPPPGSAPPPACPRCGQPTVFVPEARRYYCTRCTQYV